MGMGGPGGQWGALGGQLQYPGKRNAVPNQGKRGKWRCLYKFLRYKMFVLILKGLFRDFARWHSG